MSVSREVVRKLSIYKQGLHQRPETSTKADLKRIIERVGLLQLDSVSVTARSHYLVMLSRAGLYEREELDALLPERFLFEQWAHVACLIPMVHYEYFKPIMDGRRAQYEQYAEKLGDDGADLLNNVLSEIREHGALSSKEFKTDRKKGGTWWNWKPSKRALEYLFDMGILMTDHRRNFHRYYDLAERVLDKVEYSEDRTLVDFWEWSTLTALQHVGVGTVGHIADYYRQKKTVVRDMLTQAVERGVVQTVEVEGWSETAYLHVNDVDLLAEIADGAHEPEVTTFLTPFDNLIWHRDRVEDLWGFYYRVEMYTPAPKRKYGYYVMPILHRGKLIGRIDPKIDRKSKTFRLQALYLEPDVVPTEQMAQEIANTIREFMTFHHCEHFEFGTSHPKTIGKMIKKFV